MNKEQVKQELLKETAIFYVSKLQSMCNLISKINIINDDLIRLAKPNNKQQYINLNSPRIEYYETMGNYDRQELSVLVELFGRINEKRLELEQSDLYDYVEFVRITNIEEIPEKSKEELEEELRFSDGGDFIFDWDTGFQLGGDDYGEILALVVLDKFTDNPKETHKYKELLAQKTKLELELSLMIDTCKLFE